MNPTFIERIAALVNSKGGWTHIIAAAYVSLIGAYAGVPALATALNSIYATMPAWSHEAILAALGLAAFYHNPKKGTQ